MDTGDRQPAARVLVVEDDPVVADVLRNALLADDCRVECCDNATEALARITNEYFSVVITDLRLPDGVGTEILRRNVRLHPKSAVVVVTGDSHFATAAEAIELGAFGYLPKPFAPDNVRHMIRQALERSRLIEERDHFEQLAMTDPLTHLGNRRRLERVLGNEVERSARFHHELSLLMVDLDGLKEHNDRLGRAAGDQAIRTTAALLLRTIRRVDLVCRYGGDEFAVVLPETPAEGAAAAARRYCRAVRETEELPAKLTISVGRATYPHDADNPGTLLEVADRHAYHAKENGGDRWWPE